MVNWAAHIGLNGRLYRPYNLKVKKAWKTILSLKLLIWSCDILYQSYTYKLFLKKWFSLFQIDTLPSSNKKLSSDDFYLKFEIDSLLYFENIEISNVNEKFIQDILLFTKMFWNQMMKIKKEGLHIIILFQKIPLIIGTYT